MGVFKLLRNLTKKSKKKLTLSEAEMLAKGKYLIGTKYISASSDLNNLRFDNNGDPFHSTVGSLSFNFFVHSSKGIRIPIDEYEEADRYVDTLTDGHGGWLYYKGVWATTLEDYRIDNKPKPIKRKKRRKLKLER